MSKKMLGFLSEFVITKGIKGDLLNIDNPLFYATNTVNASIEKNKEDKTSLFESISKDLLLKDGEDDIDEMEKQGLVEVKDLDITNLGSVNEYEIDKAVIDLRISKELLTSCESYGEIVASPTGVDSSPYRYFYVNKHGSSIALLYYQNKNNNIGVIRQDNGSDLYFLDGFTSNTGVFPEKDTYINELILKSYLSVMANGGFKADGFDKELSGSLKQIFNFYIYKSKIGFYNSKVSYVSMIGGRNRENWKLRADVINNLKGQICWLKETEKFKSVLEKVDFVASNHCVAKTSMTQGEKFLLMSSPEKARNWEAQFIQGKYDVSTTILPTMKVDKEIEKYNMVFGTIVNDKDNNQYGNALWQNNYAGKTYAVVNGLPIRVKYSTQKASSDISITDSDGNSVDKWMICPINEMSSESGFEEIDDKPDNILQLIHMGLTPEHVLITVDGLTYEAIMFRGIPQYIDYLTSSDYNVDKSFELKPYSTMFSCIANHVATAMGEDVLDDFIHRLTGLINHRKLNQVANLAGKGVESAKLVEIK